MTAVSDTGVDMDVLSEWLRNRDVPFVAPLSARRLTGGHSNLTLQLVDGEGHAMVLRRPPLHGRVESAHDMDREARVLHALRGSRVPVPDVIANEPRGDVIGVPFFIMDFVDGVVVRDSAAAHSIAPATRRASASALVSTLVDLHGVAPRSVGLSDFGRHDSYVDRQLRRWRRQLDGLESPMLARIERLHEALSHDQPEQQSVSIVHGDYRLDNTVVSRKTGKLLAVLDWELSTLGDPLADLGMLVVYWAESPSEYPVLEDPPTTLDGFPSRVEIVDEYDRLSPLDLSRLPYYVVFGLWKIAIIMLGVHQRSLTSSRVDMDPYVADLPNRADALLTQADAVLRSDDLEFTELRR